MGVLCIAVRAVDSAAVAADLELASVALHSFVTVAMAVLESFGGLVEPIQQRIQQM
jgi:hypothetical protein